MKKTVPKRPPGLRQNKINSFLQKQIAEILLREKYAGITGLVTIHKVEATADLREAKIWFSSVGQEPESVLEILNRNLYDIQGQLYENSTMRMVPRIRFYIDTSEKFASDINQVFQKLKDEEDRG